MHGELLPYWLASCLTASQLVAFFVAWLLSTLPSRERSSNGEAVAIIATGAVEVLHPCFRGPCQLCRNAAGRNGRQVPHPNPTYPTYTRLLCCRAVVLLRHCWCALHLGPHANIPTCWEALLSHTATRYI